MATAAPNAAMESASVAVPAAGASGGGGGGCGEDVTARVVRKRYEGLITVRCKAIKGKGAWYWTHLEPFLVLSSDTGLPKAVKLRCSLCDAVFSASNPSRTASEHLKRGTCPSFSSSSSTPPNTLSPTPPPPSSAAASEHQLQLPIPSRKRAAAAYQITPLTVVDPSQLCFGEMGGYPAPVPTPTPVSEVRQHQRQQQHLVLSGGKEDLGALAMLEDSVKRLRSPKESPGPALGRSQANCAVRLLAEWVYESCGVVSFSCVEHPKFRAFLHQVGLPPISPRELAGPRLDACYNEAMSEVEARIQDAAFFQLSANGWKQPQVGERAADIAISLTINLPNGSSVFQRVALAPQSVPSDYAEEVLWETITVISHGITTAQQRCVGIVADRFKKALRNLENQHNWMVNLYCQFQGFRSLIKDFAKELPPFQKVTQNCFKIANFINTNSQVRKSIQAYQLNDLEHSCLIRMPFDLKGGEILDPDILCAMLEDVTCYSDALQTLAHGDSFKVVSMEDPAVREVAEMVGNAEFWGELEAVNSLVRVVTEMARDIESEKPLVGECLLLWEELRRRVRDWCKKFNVPEGPLRAVIERRFRKNYHPAWSASFILDPLYLMRDNSGKYLPQFKCLTQEQEKDVDKLITRLVSKEEAHIALMELMKWRSEGLDPLYAQAVQVKRRDPMTGKMKAVNPQSSRLVWETHLSEFKLLGKVAVRLIFLHATSSRLKCNWPSLQWIGARSHSRAAMDRAQKMIFIAENSKMNWRDSSSEEKDVEIFANGEDDVLNEVFMDASSA